MDDAGSSFDVDDGPRLAEPVRRIENNAFLIVGRGEAPKNTLVPVTPMFGLVLAPALTVVDIPTGLPNIVSTRAALQRIFRLNADRSGKLHLLELAEPVLQNGPWRLEAGGWRLEA